MAIRPYAVLFLALCSNAVIAQQKGNPAMSCYRSLSGDARFAPLRDKVALGGSMEELRSTARSTEHASAEHVPILTAWQNAREECRRLELPYYATRDAGIQEADREHHAAINALIAEVQSGKLGYGEFSRRRIELHEKVTRRIEEIRRSILPPKLPPPPGKQ